MAIRDIFKVNRKTFVDPRSWIGYDSIREQNTTIWTTVRNVFVPAKATNTETFSDAIKRLKISEEGLKETESAYQFYSWMFLLLAAVMLFVGFYELFKYGSFSGFALSVAMVALFGAQAFRFSFWSFQIKHRKLGCTIEEWRQGKPFENKGASE